MDGTASPSFVDLARARRSLLEASRRHVEALSLFRPKKNPWFRVDRHKPEEGSRRPVRHLTTTASCLESLSDVPREDDGESPGLVLAKEIATVLSDAVFDGENTWRSEGSAEIYCRVRTLPIILRLGDKERLGRHKRKIEKILNEIWKPVRLFPRWEGVATSRTRKSVVVDSARTRSQLTSLQRLARAAGYRCVTIYVTASEPVRRQRFDLARAIGSDFEMKEWRRLASHELEAQTKRLRSAADIVIDTTKLSRRDLRSLVRSLVVR